MIFIRADANPKIGMGHIMRCLSIADAAANLGQDTTFILADDNVYSLVRSRGYKVIILHSSYNDMESELSIWPDTGPNRIIVDSYFITDKYLLSLKNKVGQNGKLIYIDDLASFPYPVDVIVNYNAYGPNIDYRGLYHISGVNMPDLILGSTYVPLRSMFRNIPHKVQNEKTDNILISTGGSDNLHLTLALVHYLCSESRKYEDKTFHFLLGAMNTDKEEIGVMAAGCDRIILHENVSDMKELISSCDLVVSAAGSTMYEICACGVPLITYSSADNQIPGTEAFDTLGLAVNIGDLRDPDSVDSSLVMSGKLDGSAADRIFAAVDELSNDFNKRCEIGFKMQEMVDGFGADRMVREILDR